MIKKVIYFSAMCMIMGFFVAACSPAKGNTVAIPNVQNGGSPTATLAGGAYPAASANPTKAAVQPQQNQAAYPAAIAAPLKVTKADGTSISLDATALNNMPTHTVNSISGISITSILAAAGITDYKQITFISASGSQSLAKDKVNENVILKINDDGTFQLVSPDLPQDNWLKAVSTIKAE